MERKNRNVFWQAFIIAMILFWSGILLGAYFERSRINSVNDLYSTSEVEVNDFKLSSDMVFGGNLSCDSLNQEALSFADRIYMEALKLEKFDSSNQIMSDSFVLHKKYDLLRTMLWSEIIKNKKTCGNLNTVVYFYDYVDPSFETRTKQGVISNYLADLKNRKGDDIVLIPVAVDTDLSSLNILLERYNVTSFPSVLVNERYVVRDLDSLGNIEGHLN